MHSSNPSTSEHGGSKEGGSRHVERNPVPLLHSLGLQGIGDLTGHLEELPTEGQSKERSIDDNTSQGVIQRGGRAGISPLIILVYMQNAQ